MKTEKEKKFRLAFGGGERLKCITAFTVSGEKQPTSVEMGYIKHAFPMSEDETVQIQSIEDANGVVFAGYGLDEVNIYPGQWVKCLKASDKTAFAVAEDEENLPDADHSDTIYMVGNMVWPDPYKTFKG